ncbi:MAG TPA: hypothetical protein VFE33_19445 [Thermoanaerobaculia bacterium]|nr:hypothetical protein [Thermoanaerobaculia bacterium]
MSDESAVTIGRKAFIATLISIALTPVSVALGFFLSHYLQAPKLVPQYVRTTAYSEDSKFDDGVFRKIEADKRLEGQLRQALQLAPNINNPEQTCTEWLDDQKAWVDSCLPRVQAAVNSIQVAASGEYSSISHDVTAIEQWSPGKDLDLEPSGLLDIGTLSLLAHRDKSAALATLRGPLRIIKAQTENLSALSREIQRIAETQANTPRTGEVIFRIGLLNSGDSDGVVFDKASLRFGASTVALIADTYTVVKSHSFEEISFSVDGNNNNASSLKSLATIIKSKSSASLKILLDTGTKTVPAGGNFPS